MCSRAYGAKCEYVDTCHYISVSLCAMAAYNGTALDCLATPTAFLRLIHITCSLQGSASSFVAYDDIVTAEDPPPQSGYAWSDSQDTDCDAAEDGSDAQSETNTTPQDQGLHLDNIEAQVVETQHSLEAKEACNMQVLLRLLHTYL